MKEKKSGVRDLFILLGVVLAAVLIFVGVTVGSDVVKDNGFAKYTDEINYKQFQEAVDAKEDFILFYGSNSCSACESYRPIYGDVAKYNEDVTTYYIDIDSLNEEDRKAISADLGAKATPTLYVYVDGQKEYKTIEGSVDRTETEDLFDYFKKVSEKEK